MKNFLFFISLISLVYLCSYRKKPLTEEQKLEYEEGILNCYVMQGPNGTQDYIDVLIAEGKLSREKGNEIKDAIPKGEEHLKKTLKKNK